MRATSCPQSIQGIIVGKANLRWTTQNLSFTTRVENIQVSDDRICHHKNDNIKGRLYGSQTKPAYPLIAMDCRVLNIGCLLRVLLFGDALFVEQICFLTYIGMCELLNRCLLSARVFHFYVLCILPASHCISKKNMSSAKSKIWYRPQSTGSRNSPIIPGWFFSLKFQVLKPKYN